MDNVRTQVKQILSIRFRIPLEQLVDNAYVIEELGGDSLDFVEAVMEIEQRFTIEIPDVDAEALRTVNDVCSYVERAVCR